MDLEPFDSLLQARVSCTVSLVCFAGGVKAFSFLQRSPEDPLSSQYGICKSVKARFWPWPLGKSPYTFLRVIRQWS